MFDYFRDQSISVKKAAGLTPEELTGKIVVGELLDIEKPVLDENLAAMRNQLRENTTNG